MLLRASIPFKPRRVFCSIPGNIHVHRVACLWTGFRAVSQERLRAEFAYF